MSNGLLGMAALLGCVSVGLHFLGVHQDKTEEKIGSLEYRLCQAKGGEKTACQAMCLSLSASQLEGCNIESQKEE